jgi:hypothetical protein
MKATGLTNTGGAATEYRISPELPKGLTLNTTTGKISGKPALTQPKRSYLLSATNISGTSTKKITIEIVSKPSVKLSKTNFLVTWEKILIRKLFQINHVVLKNHSVNVLVYHLIMLFEFLQVLFFVFYTVEFTNEFSTP